MTVCKKCGLRWELRDSTEEEEYYGMCWRCIERARENGEIPLKKELENPLEHIISDILFKELQKLERKE